jgi:hypothetical protein
LRPLIALALTTDGRKDCIEQTIPSLLQRVEGIDGPRLIFDDSGDRGYVRWLRQTFQPLGFEIAHGKDYERVGQGEALCRMWGHLSGRSYQEHPWIFHCEDDFLFEHDVDLREMVDVLEPRPYLAQMALLRQPWFPGEVKAGGIVERDPDEYERVVEGDREWLQHRLWFTLNPCLYRRELCELDRPTGHKHEWHFSRQLCKDPDVQFGIWGDGTPWVRHIGEKRFGRGY